MSAAPSLESALLNLFAKNRSLGAGDISKKIGEPTTRSPKIKAAPDEVDHAITSLIESGMLRLQGGDKNTLHPRKSGRYILTPNGKDHIEPKKPDTSDELIGNQEAYILFQFLRIKDGASFMTRSDLNGKLGTKTAKGQFELDPKDNKTTVDYHLHQLVQNGSLEEERKGVSDVYTLTAEGLKTLGSGKQYDNKNVTFTLTGPALNKLLEAARGSSAQPAAPERHGTHKPATEPVHHAAPKAAEVEPKQIHEFIKHLKADKFAGKDLVPVHEVRSLVAQHHGNHAASHPVFDRLLKTMRSEGELELEAIADSRNTPQEHLDDSIPGLHETLFFIATK